MDPVPSPYIRDIKWPSNASGSKAAASTEPDAPGKTELVNNIPVKAQGGQAPTNNPIANQNPVPAAPHHQADQKFDQILKDVSTEVKKESAKSDVKKSRFGFKQKEAVHSGPQAAKNSHMLPIAVAVIVALVLVFAAFSAFKSGGA